MARVRTRRNKEKEGREEKGKEFCGDGRAKRMKE